jgi:hypothetical protein
MRTSLLLVALAATGAPLLSDGAIPPAPYAELTARGREVRGLFLPTPHLALRGHREIAKMAKASRLDAVVFDLKDERGRVLYDTRVPALRPSRVVVHRDVGAIVADLHARGHYVVGRIVCFKDDQLAQSHPELAVTDDRNGRPWRSASRSHWVDPGHPDVVAALVGVAREAEAFGFDEVQFDYVRYPVDFRSDHAVFPTNDGTLRRYVIARFLAAADAAIGIPISVDVFGLTVYRDGDPSGLGQSLEDMAPHIEVLSPMLYASDFTPDWVRTNAEHPIATIIWTAVRAARRRLGDDIAIRPYLQAFDFRSPNYGPDFMRAQIMAARGAGADGMLFWNAGCSYGMVFRTLATIGPFRSDRVASF